MLNTYQIRNLIAYGVALPLVLVVGYFISQTDDVFSLMVLTSVLLLGCLPFLIGSHHRLLIISWNATMVIYFLPGQPDLWVIMTILSFILSVCTRSITSKPKLRVPTALSWPLLVLGAIVTITAIARRMVVDESGAAPETRRYIFIMVAILGFFAISYKAIQKKDALLVAGLFFLAGLTAVMSDIIYAAGPSFYFLFFFFPAGLARLQFLSDFSAAGDTVYRIEGLAWASVAFSCFMLLRYGAAGILDLRRPWRLIIFLAAVTLGLVGGFRSRLFLIVLLFAVQFCFEGLWRTRWLLVLLGGILIIGMTVLPLTSKLPRPVQRALSFLPVEVDPSVKKDAEETTIWRLEMWQTVLPEVPKYLWFGKGYSYSLSDHYLTDFAAVRGLRKSYEISMLLGEYHNGPLSVIIPFGIWGFLAFIWFIIAGWRALYTNYRYGDRDLQKINTFLLTYYTVRTIFFFTIYGSFQSEIMIFTGVLGLSVAINQGVRKKGSHDPSESLPTPPPTDGQRLLGQPILNHA